MMVLSQITPVGSDFMKDWPGQNTVNCDRIDAYAGPCLTTHPLRTYTPIFSAVTTAPTLGTGGSAILRGNYYQIFDQLYVWAEFRFGTGFAVGSGNYTMSLPFDVDSITGPSVNMGEAPIVGNGILWDASTLLGRQPLVVSLRTSNLVQFGTKMNSGIRIVNDTTPVTWALDDGITFAARFKRIP